MIQDYRKYIDILNYPMKINIILLTHTFPPKVCSHEISQTIIIVKANTYVSIFQKQYYIYLLNSEVLPSLLQLIFLPVQMHVVREIVLLSP